MKRWIALCLLVLLSARSLAQVQPVVEVTITPQQVRVGEPLELQVTVLVPTWFAQPPNYPDFELANAITQRPPDSSFPTSRAIDGETWSGIVRSFRIYPLQAGQYRIDDAELGVSYANPGSAPTRLQVALPEIRFSAVVPPGAESLTPYLAGNALRLSLEVGGDTGSLQPGDAVTLVYRAELEGLPAIFLPPLAPKLDYAGASVYADRPTTADGPPATRSEKLTLVFEAGGAFSVPPVTLSYWNTDTDRVEQATADGVTLQVSGAAPVQDDAADTRDNALRWPLLGAVVAAFLLALACWRSWQQSLRPRWQAYRQRHLNSEAHAFKVLQQRLRAQDRAAAYRALLAWSAHLTPTMDSREFAQRYGDEALSRALDRWRIALFSRGEEAPVGSALGKKLQTARQRYLKARRKPAAHALPPLNP
jgi:hypothetical protein